ncbi:MAG TPA: DNA polymerase III subunit delta [Candidatus Acidoferrales bacterium]|nr:DNA polymerase III subunit delta [Candidatus Acidoferrales bacterium]
MNSVESVRAAIAKNVARPLILLYGDDFAVRSATGALIADLVPAESLAFNLEKFDGRSAPWEQIAAALLTPPLFPGRKLVVVENAPYFLAQERRGDVLARVLELWNESKQEEAARLLLDLLSLQGLSQEEWARAEGALAAPHIASLCGADDERDISQIEDILAFCRSRGIGIEPRSARAGHGLAELIEQGLPAWASLLLTAVHADRRTRLYRRFEEKGHVVDLTLQRDRSGRVARDALAEVLERRLAESGKRMEPAAKELVLQRAGKELWAFHQEIEKLFLYVGDAQLISAADVENVVVDRGEDWIFDLTAALARKDALAALKHLGRLLAQGDHPLKILAVLASEVRRLLSARALIERDLRGGWKRSMSFTQFQNQLAAKGGLSLTRNAYADYMALQRAENFSTSELVAYLALIRDTDVRLKSTGAPAARVLERLILDMCLGAKPGTVRASAQAG